MFKKKMFIAFIPARGGSKQIKNKNIKTFFGKPLIFWTIEEAIKSKFISDIYLSTDSNKIKDKCKKFKDKIKIIKRPKNLSGDKVTMFSVIKNFYDEYSLKKKNFNGLILLQPTSPLRNFKDIDKSCQLFNKYNADTLISVSKLKHQYHPDNIYKKKGSYLKKISKIKKTTLRQKKPTYYSGNGSAIYITKKTKLKKYIVGGKILSYEMPFIRSIDIDDIYDFKLSELIKKNEIW